MAAPVTTRVRSLEDADRVARNHHERLVELEERARVSGQRWRTWAGAALQPTSETQDISRSNFLYIMNAAGSGILAFDHDSREKLVAIHAVVEPAAVGSMDLSLRSRPGSSGGGQIGPSAINLTADIELLSVPDLSAEIETTAADSFCVFVQGGVADRVYTVVVVTEPR